MTFEEAYQDLIWNIWPKVKMFGSEVWTYCVDLWKQTPHAIQNMFVALFYIALLGIAISLIKSIIINYKSWKPDPDSKLMLSYFCGTGNYQRKLIYHSAKALLFDRKWHTAWGIVIANQKSSCSSALLHIYL